MRPLDRALLASLAALGVGVPSSLAIAAHPTRVLTAAEPEAPLPDLHLGVRFEREERQGSITREWVDPQLGPGDVSELDWTSVTNTLEIDGRVGLFRDLELSIAAPIVLAYDSELSFSEGVEGRSTVYAPASASTPITNANDRSVPYAFPITAIPSSRHRSGFGDMRFGLAWSPTVDRKDEAWPTLTFRGEVTTPTGDVWDPADPEALPGGSGGSVGRGQTVIDLSLGLSQRAVPGAPTLDPYILFGGRLPFATSAQSELGMEPPASARVRAGTELVLAGDADDRTHFAFGLEVLARYIGAGRTYSALSDYLPSFDPTRTDVDTIGFDQYADPSNYRNADNPGLNCSGLVYDRDAGTREATPGVACGELTQVEEHIELGGEINLSAKPTPWTLFRAGFALRYVSDHVLTSENAGVDSDPEGSNAICGGGPCLGRINRQNSLGVDERNPHYDPRYDAPGRRFRLESSFVWSFFVEAHATF